MSDDLEPTAAELIAARPALGVDTQAGLMLDGVPLAGIARAAGTPCWATSAATLRARFGRLQRAMPHTAIHFAVKANDQHAVLATLAAAGAGADAVSIGECRAALQAGIAPAHIVFSGVGKTARELAAALHLGIGQINVESAEELHELSAIAAAAGITASVALRINPDVDAGTHAKIATGRAGDKFGVPLGQASGLYLAAARLPGLRMVGLAVHIGSQVSQLAPFATAYRRMADLVAAIRAQGGHVAAMDCGGGLAYPYANEPGVLPEAWAGCIHAAFGQLGLRLSVEPGRWLAAPAGLLLASVIRTRRAGMPHPVVILDAAMNDLARPALYGAWHGVLPVSPAALRAALNAPGERVDIVGPVCESSDVFARNRALAPLAPNSLVAILDCGAYGSTMSSTYNARPLAPQMLVDQALPGAMLLTRQRGAADQLVVPAAPAPRLARAAVAV